MGFLTQQEATSLRITNMILHVVGVETFTAERERAVEHAEFFIDRIRDTDVAPIYSFNDDSPTKAQLERIASRTDSFEQGAQNLSRDFARLHVGTSRDGAFFIFELETDEAQTKIYSLIKYDYRQVIEQADSVDGGLLRRIVHAFIDDKKAIQKSAIVRVVNGVAHADLSARDRVKAPPEIGDYFANFLGVTRTLSDQQLNVRLVDVLRGTLTACKELLPDQDVARAFRRAKAILRDRLEIGEVPIAEAVVAVAGNPEDENIRAELQAQLSRRIRSSKLEGLMFPPDQQILQKPPLRKVRTTEGVTLMYPDDSGDTTVARAPREGGGEVITISTRQIVEDSVVRDSAR